MDVRTTSAQLYLDGVTVSFDGFRALDKLSLTVEPGEMRAIIGPNGAGKTTMMDVITGKTRPDGGDVYFEGAFDLSRLDETEIAELASAGIRSSETGRRSVRRVRIAWTRRVASGVTSIRSRSTSSASRSGFC